MKLPPTLVAFFARPIAGLCFVLSNSPGITFKRFFRGVVLLEIERLLAEVQAKQTGQPTQYTPGELSQMIADWEALTEELRRYPDNSSNAR